MHFHHVSFLGPTFIIIVASIGPLEPFDNTANPPLIFLFLMVFMSPICVKCLVRSDYAFSLCVRPMTS
jgi:hypothetical protein